MSFYSLGKDADMYIIDKMLTLSIEQRRVGNLKTWEKFWNSYPIAFKLSQLV